MTTPMQSTHVVTTEGLGPVPVTLIERGSGQPVLLLHGGAGSFSVAGFAELLASADARVLTPVHPGFDGTPRPERLDSIKALAGVYVQLLSDLDVSDVCVIGNSIGGWIAAEIALAESARPSGRVSSVVLVDAAGLKLDAAPVPDFFQLSLDEVFALSYFDPDKYRIDPASLTDQQKLVRAANTAALLTYAGAAMSDGSLLGRLPGVTIPTLVVWGAADRMIPAEHGHAYADAIPGAEFRLIATAGHLPQLETSAELLLLAGEFARSHASPVAG
ncbi:MAG: alpha/beta fold hydrolase [Streptosporangiaceae bacterium]